MASTVVNKTYGVITATSADWDTAVTLVTVGAAENLHIKTVKVVDAGGVGGEVRIIINDGTSGATDYYLDSFTVAGSDSLDCSPLVPYAIESGWVLQVQAKGGASIHITLTGVLQALVA